MLERIIVLLKKILGDKAEDVPITAETDIFSDLGFQSLSIISLVVLCEAEFGVELSSQIGSIADVSKVSELIALIESCDGI